MREDLIRDHCGGPEHESTIAKKSFLNGGLSAMLEEGFQVCLKAPSKTFVVGEYLALFGGPSLVVTTSPMFEMTVSRGDGVCPFHQQSPAGQVWKKNPELYSKLLVEFSDPYLGAGGLGASTAQFLMVEQLRSLIVTGEARNVHNLWKQYREVCKPKVGYSPSGADLVAQMVGGLTHVEFTQDGDDIQTSQLKYRRMLWPFESLQLLLFKTGHKIATHDHLADELQINDVDALKSTVREMFEGFDRLNSDIVVSAIGKYGQQMQERGLTSGATIELIKKMKESCGEKIMAVKGCGALGADVMLVICRQEWSAQIIECARKYGMNLIGTERNIDKGLQWETT